jgi:hypothetical protein
MEETMPGTRLDLKHWRFEIDFEKIGWAILDQAGESTNTFGTETTTELERLVSAVEAMKENEAYEKAKSSCFIVFAHYLQRTTNVVNDFIYF